MSKTQNSSNRLSIGPTRLVLLAGVGVFCLWLGVVAARPYKAARAMKLSDDRLESRVEKLKIENQQDSVDIEMAHKPAGIQLAARKLGYVAKGESYLEIGEH